MPNIGGLFQKDVVLVLSVKSKAVGNVFFFSSGKLSGVIQVQNWVCLQEVELQGQQGLGCAFAKCCLFLE